MVGSLLSHEFMHSWNGKFRRPADLTTPEYETPMQTDLLWVYEGLTEYLGPMLAARSGLSTPEQYHSYLASIAASLGPGRPGRTWRPLLDTAVGEPGIRPPRGWMDWVRGTDYFDEGDLLWLEVATILDRASNGQKSIDDFCHAFHGGPNDGPQVKTYTFGQFVETLNSVVPYDWAAFFKKHLNSLSPEPPVGGIENGGWKVDYTAEPLRLPRSPLPASGTSIRSVSRCAGRNRERVDCRQPRVQGWHWLGNEDRWHQRAHLHPRCARRCRQISAPDPDAVIADDYYKTVTVDYGGGPRFPHLVRVEGKPDLLDDLIKPRAETK